MPEPTVRLHAVRTAEITWADDADEAGRRRAEVTSTLSGLLDTPPSVELTSSCTHALEAAATLIDIGPGDEVIVPAFAFPSAANAFLLRGATIRFADIDPTTGNVAPASVEERTTERTRAVACVHYGGVACDMDALAGLSASAGWTLVEDAAHGLFGRYRSTPLGRFGRLGCVSFHRTKNISSIDGGALVVNDPALIESARVALDKGTNRVDFDEGRVSSYDWTGPGSAWRLSDGLIGVLAGQLERRDEVQTRRTAVWNRYATELASWAGSTGARLPLVPDGVDHPAHLFWIVLPTHADRDRFVEWCRRSGIETARHYGSLPAEPVRPGDLVTRRSVPHSRGLRRSPGADPDARSAHRERRGSRDRGRFHLSAEQPVNPAGAERFRARPTDGLWRLAVPSFVVLGALQFRDARRLSFLGDDTWNLAAAADGSVLGEYPGYGVQIFRPISSLWFWLEYQIFGLDPLGYHWVSVALHLVNALLVVALASMVFQAMGRVPGNEEVARWSRPAALIAGIVFLLHPSHGEAVFWITAQPDLLATFLSLVAFLAFVRSFGGGPAWRTVSVVAVFLALLSKESAVGSLLALTLAGSLMPFLTSRSTGQPFRSAIHRTAPYVAVGVGYLALRWATLETPIGGYGPDAYLGQSFGRFAGHSALAAARTLLPAMPPYGWVLSATLAVAVAAAARWFRRRRPVLRRPLVSLVLILVVLAVLTLSPVAPLGVSATGPQGERYAYLPSVFTSMLLAAPAALLLLRSRRATTVGAALALVLLMGTGVREGSRWTAASAAADGMTRSLDDVRSDSVLLLNVPDTVRGAVAFRNSAGGLDLYGTRFATLTARVVTTRDFRTSQDVDHALPTNADHTIRIVVSNPPPSGLTRPSAADDGPWTIHTTGPTTYDVVFSEPVDLDSVRYFSGGRLHGVE